MGNLFFKKTAYKVSVSNYETHEKSLDVSPWSWSYAVQIFPAQSAVSLAREAPVLALHWIIFSPLHILY